MSRRSKLLILGGILLAVILLLLWWFLRQAPAAPVAQPVVVKSPEAPVPATPTPTEAARIQQSGAETVAMTFAARYGSFSTEAAFQNLRDVIPLATPVFAAQLEAQADAGTPSTDYYGVKTNAIALTTDHMDDAAGTARFTVHTQRQEAIGSTQKLSVKYQDLELTMEKVAGAWKVSGATWK